ncbi:MAG: phosphatase PAP2 family protein [candidate division KSB1 bacterium]|nr:phosphatase PAP2 family protein [candidate division KSB1 bacterium]
MGKRIFLNRLFISCLCLALIFTGKGYASDWDIKSDYSQYYSVNTLRRAAPLFGLAAAGAHSGLDMQIRHGYQSLRGPSGDQVSSWCKQPGEGKLLIPAALLTASLQLFSDDESILSPVTQWGQRVTRSYLVGAPPLLLMQRFTGGSRPGETDDGAQWRPMQDANGVSGHAFMGAVPFLVLGNLQESSWVKAVALFASALPAWSRVHDDKHFLSQAVLGWSMAKWAVDAVTGSYKPNPDVYITPAGRRWVLGVNWCW